jgi:hypothetical protein
VRHAERPQSIDGLSSSAELSSTNGSQRIDIHSCRAWSPATCRTADPVRSSLELTRTAGPATRACPAHQALALTGGASRAKASIAVLLLRLSGCSRASELGQPLGLVRFAHRFSSPRSVRTLRFLAQRKTRSDQNARARLLSRALRQQSLNFTWIVKLSKRNSGTASCCNPGQVRRSSGLRSSCPKNLGPHRSERVNTNRDG